LSNLSLPTKNWENSLNKEYFKRKKIQWNYFVFVNNSFSFKSYNVFIFRLLKNVSDNVNSILFKMNLVRSFFRITFLQKFSVLPWNYFKKSCLFEWELILIFLSKDVPSKIFLNFERIFLNKTKVDLMNQNKFKNRLSKKKFIFRYF
jgi:hypothetical protein